MKKIIGLGLLGMAAYIGWRLWPRAQAAPAPAAAATTDTGNKIFQAIKEFWPPPTAPVPTAPEQPYVGYVGIPLHELGYGGDPFLTEPITAPKETFGIAYPGGSVTFDESAGSGQLNQILF